MVIKLLVLSLLSTHSFLNIWKNIFMCKNPAYDLKKTKKHGFSYTERNNEQPKAFSPWTPRTCRDVSLFQKYTKQQSFQCFSPHTQWCSSDGEACGLLVNWTCQHFRNTEFLSFISGTSPTSGATVYLVVCFVLVPLTSYGHFNDFSVEVFASNITYNHFTL